ncbi:MAG: hypothetical protein P8O03_06110 [Ilumatobacter sp.]|nr:hypothetical protein [Ilumatobacter sp.]MDG2040087.1 hypothetical protein [Ilumatobacter sp.]
MTTLIARSTLVRACVESVRTAAHAVVPARDTFQTAVAGAVTVTIPWRCTDVQGLAFNLTYTTKRIAPGRLEGMT